MLKKNKLLKIIIYHAGFVT